ncbi:hypothetical protein N7481_011457 [Penicillium waksmanii]|uniref:uncharacterized protein n=1 Tax=Penicillium waksmanii TaxID=69791 RepID=UPI0025490610|nr:uncharacterized protein N7481_011457 [Penicillium waksmanii]KAJ5974247.1 hypothetical protein N7481_011457 [Penicillium waksmanii]
MKRKESKTQEKCSPEDTEAWILGSGTSSLASAYFLIKQAGIPPPKVHILESSDSIQQVLHRNGDATSGYDQLAGCLPVPIGGPLKEILADIPSSILTPGRAQSFLHDIESAEVKRNFRKESSGISILIEKDHVLKKIATASLNLGLKHRLNLIRFIAKREKRLGRNQIKDFLPESFFQTSFWAIWSAQFGLQPWHSATEFRRAIRQYIGEFHGLSILSGLDITGPYQYESIFLPIFIFLQSLNVDFQFDTRVTGISTTKSNNDTQRVSRLDVIQDGFKRRNDLGPHDVVIATIGSTMSGTAIGSNDEQPLILSHYPNEELDENWSIWLALCSKDKEFGNPYSFCTRRSQSMLESFTITTEELTLFNYLTSVSLSTSTTGALIVLQESQWKLNLCIPAQPVFRDQPQNVRVLWGFALFPECRGNYIKKPMLQCSGAEILAEVLKHVNFPTELLFRHTVTIPRVMPRMSSLLLAHSWDERPEPVPCRTSNIGLVGQFVEIPEYSCLDMSYGVRSAQIAVSQLLDLAIPSVRMRRSQFNIFLRILLWR